MSRLDDLQQVIGAAVFNRSLYEGLRETGNGGAICQATEYDGVNEYYTKARFTSATITQLSIAAWVNFSGGTGDDVIVRDYTSAGYMLLYSYSTSKFWCYLGAGAQGFRSQATYSAGDEWRHIAITYNAGTAKMYYNGSQITTDNLGGGGPAASITPDGAFFLSHSASLFKGQMAHVVMEEAEWSAATVAAIHSSATIPAGAWYWPKANHEETQQALGDLTANGTPTLVTVDCATFGL